MTKVIIEHDMHVVFSLADRITVLAQGTDHRRGRPRRDQGDPRVQEAYLGGAHTMSADRNAGRHASPPAGRPKPRRAVSSRARHPRLLRRKLHRAGRVASTSAQGEILALLGRNGAGKTSTLRAIARLGDPSLQAGEIWLDGKPMHAMKAFAGGPRQASSWCPRTGASSPGLTVEENLSSAQVAPGHGWTLERIYEHFPRLAERRKQEGVTLVGRRAADAGGGARAGPRPQAAAARRAL